MSSLRQAPASHRAAPAALAAAAVLLAGCASTRLDAQWSDPQLSANPLRGARIMVACEAHDLVVKRICQDQLAAEVVARGATPVIAPDTTNPAPGRPLGDEQYLNAARNTGARALWTHYVAPATASGGSGVSVGLGAFGIGGGSVRGGVGVSLPVGGGQTSFGYSLNSRVTDARSGRLLWTAKATAPPSNDLNLQLYELSKAVFAAADKTPLF
ncbi:MAG TPA: hypothetical protein VGE16_14460 [Albitalea sp.]